MSRYGAAAIRFGLSCIVFFALGYVIAFVWYPGFLFETDGGWQGIQILLAVDLVLGTLLTLVVFKAGKHGLGFDLAITGGMQALCLVVGTWIVYSERPIAMVFVDGQFFSVSRGDYTDDGVEIPELDAFPGPHPKWVMVNVPEDFEEQSELRLEMLRSGVPLRLAVSRYVPFEISAAFASTPIDSGEPASVGSDMPVVTPSSVEGQRRFFPFGARYTTGVIGFDTLTGTLVGVVGDKESESNEARVHG